jgi:hypothetical protein
MLAERLEEFLATAEEEGDRTDAFWLKVKDNLQLGRIRLIFVADEIPLELRRIVEFLNQQMDPAEVLAIEVRQFTNDSVKTLVPRLFGQTVTARDKKGPRPLRRWEEASFFQDLEERRGEREAAVCRAIFDWSIRRGLKIEWGKGSQDGSFLVRLQTERATYNLLNAYTYGRIEVPLKHLKRTPPFDDDEKRLDLLKRLNTIPGVEIERDGIERWPRISLSILTRDSAVAKLIDAFEWVVAEVTGVDSETVPHSRSV